MASKYGIASIILLIFHVLGLILLESEPHVSTKKVGATALSMYSSDSKNKQKIPVVKACSTVLMDYNNIFIYYCPGEFQVSLKTNT